MNAVKYLNADKLSIHAMRSIKNNAMSHGKTIMKTFTACP